MANIIDFFKNRKYKIQRGGLRYSEYLRQNGVEDNISLSVAKKYDHIFIPNEVGEELKNISDFKKSTMFIYKAKYNEDALPTVVDVLNSGVPMDSCNILETTVSCPNFWQLMNKLVVSEKHELSFLIKIPNDILKGSKPIYYKEDDEIRLLSEYIYGLVDIENNKVNIVKNAKYTDNHDYLDDGLLYEGEETQRIAK